MSASNTTPQTTSASTTGRVTFQSTPNSGVNSTRSNEDPASPNLELSKEEVFENNLTQLFIEGFLAVVTSDEQKSCAQRVQGLPNLIQHAVLESLHLTHPGIWGMIILGQNVFWPYMHREFLNKAAKCKPCTEIGKSLKPINTASQWKPPVNCSEPNEERHIDFGGPIRSEKDKDVHFFGMYQSFF